MGTVEKKPRRGVGRPPKAPEKGHRRNYAFRMSDETRDRLLESATLSGRSLSEEIERRVEQSVAHDTLVGGLDAYINLGADALFAGRHNLDLFVRLSDYIFVTEQSTKKRWIEDAETKRRVLDYVRKGLPLVLDQAGEPLLSLTDHLKERARKLAEIRSRVVPDDEQENIRGAE